MAHRHPSLQRGRDMPGQLNRVNLSIASPSEIERTARQLRVMREGFLTGSLTMHTPRSMILESWQRCSNMRVNLSRRCAPLAVARESQLEHLLHNIAGQTGRLERLLDLSRIEAGALPLDRDWTELPVLIADTLAKFANLNSDCKIERHLAADLPLHYVDPDRFVQVLWNLLENASKYSSPCSPIRVEASWTGSEVLIGVADWGPGIPAGERERIFQHFYRLDRDQRAHTQGSGLGLAICRGIVEAHNGRIWVEDRPGGGSVFLIALPLPPPDPTAIEASEEPELCTVSTGGQ